MSILEAFLLIMIAGITIEAVVMPRLDWTKGKDLLLWYGGEQRNFIVLYENKK
tara:strand:+ start:1319 stop:1477 length:159 start_codon:yes stop_codon:yes gene_type:complete